MKRLNEKVIMMVRGLMIGSSMAAVLTVLVMRGKLGCGSGVAEGI